jgi:hypothetical protein
MNRPAGFFSIATLNAARASSSERLDQIDADGFRKFAREALDQFSSRKVKDADWAAFAETLDYVPAGAGADTLKAAAAEAERKLGNEIGFNSARGAGSEDQKLSHFSDPYVIGLA